MAPQSEEQKSAEKKKERADIVYKYGRGLEGGAESEEWENPKFDLYQRTDRFGFIHDARSPLVQQLADDKRMIQKEMERAEKWLKMCRNWDVYYNSDKFRSRIYKGVPDKVRGEVWIKLLGIRKIQAKQDGIYESMLNYARQYGEHVRQVDLDVNRTYRDHVMFRERFCTKQVSLFNVLIAYSVYNSEVNYCQGMSQVAALLLMYMDDEDAFWGLSILLCNEHYMMHGFFVAGFPKLMRFNDHIWALMKRQLPRLRKHFEKNDIRLDMLTVKWFMQCFLDRVPFSLALRLWDVYLYEGDRMLIAFSMATFKMHQRVLLKLRSMEEIMHYMQHKLPADFGGINDDDAIEELKSMMQLLRNRKFEKPSAAEFPQVPPGILLQNIPIGAARRSGRLSTSEVAAAAVASTAAAVAAERAVSRSNGRLSRAPSREDLANMRRDSNSQQRRSNRQLSARRASVGDDGFDIIPPVIGEEIITTTEKSSTLYDNVRGSGGGRTSSSSRAAVNRNGGELISRREYTKEEEFVTIRQPANDSTRRSSRSRRSASSSAANRQYNAEDDDVGSEAATLRASSRHRQPHPPPATVTTVHTDIVRETRRVDDGNAEFGDATLLSPGRHDVRLRRPDEISNNNADVIYNEADNLHTAADYIQQQRDEDAEERLANAEVQRITSTSNDEDLHSKIPAGGDRYVVHETLDTERIDVRLPPRYVPRGGVRVLPAIPFGHEEESTPNPHTDEPYSKVAGGFYADAPAVEVDEELARQRYLNNLEQQQQEQRQIAENIYSNGPPPPPQPSTAVEQTLIPPPVSRATKPRPVTAASSAVGGGRDEHIFEEEINQIVTTVEERRTVTRIGDLNAVAAGTLPPIRTTTTMTRNVPALVPIGTTAAIKTSVGAPPLAAATTLERQQSTDTVVSNGSSTRRRLPQVPVMDGASNIQPRTNENDAVRHITRIRISSSQPLAAAADTSLSKKRQQHLPPKPYKNFDTVKHVDQITTTTTGGAMPPFSTATPTMLSAPYVETNIDEVLPEDLLSGSSSNGGGDRKKAGKAPAALDASYSSDVYSSEEYRESLELRERQQQMQLQQKPQNFDAGFYDMPAAMRSTKQQQPPPRSWLLANGQVQNFPVDEQHYAVQTKTVDDYVNVYDQPPTSTRRNNNSVQQPLRQQTDIVDRYVENISTHFQLPPLQAHETVIPTARSTTLSHTISLPRVENDDNMASPPVEPPGRRRYYYNNAIDDAESSANIPFLPSNNSNSNAVNEPQAVRYTYYRRVSDDEELVTNVVSERRGNSEEAKKLQQPFVDSNTYYNLSSSSSIVSPQKQTAANKLTSPTRSTGDTKSRLSSSQQQYRYSNDYAAPPSRGATTMTASHRVLG